MTGIALDGKDAWDRFVSQHWERRACKLVGAPPLSSEEAFRAALATADHERTTKEVIHQVSADGHYVCEPRSMEFLARADDQTLDAYLARARRLATTGVFSINHLKIQMRAGWEVWGALVRLLAPLFEHVGFPYGGVEASLAVGADQSVLGALQTWSKWEPNAKKSGHLLFAVTGGARIEAGATRLELLPGELVYVPAHELRSIALDGLAALLVVNLESGTAEERADRMVRQLVLKSTYPTINASPHRLQRSAQRPDGVPPALREPTAELLEYARSTAFEEQLATSWLCLETGLAFAAPPAPDAEHVITRHMVIRGSPTLRWTTIGNRLLAAANGHALKFPSHSSVVSLLEELRTGGPAAIGDLVERFSIDEDGPGPEDLFALLQSLYEIRGILLAPS